LKPISARTLAIGGIVIALSINARAQGEAASAPYASALEASGASAPATGKKADRALRRKVYTAIAKHKEINAGSISVTAKGGVVALNGTVPDANQIPKVEEIVKGVPGVTSVTNKLVVQKAFGGQ
jgi:osmotically-inducible protein OsmY